MTLSAMLHDRAIELTEFCKLYGHITTRTVEYTDLFNSLYAALEKDRIIECRRHGKLVGFAEYWMVTFEQIERLYEYRNFDIAVEDVQNGPICFVAEVIIKEDFRKTSVMRYLYREFSNKTRHCQFIANEARHSKRNKFVVHKRKQEHIYAK